MLALTFDISAWRWLACKAAGLVARGVYTSPISGLGLRELPVPELPGPEWLRLRTRLGGICGTDLGVISLRLHPAHILRSFTRFPVVLGHENVAVIDKVGAAVHGWRAGQRVCVEPSLSCAVRGLSPPCRQCAAGLFSLCERFLDGPLGRGTMLGAALPVGGTWAPYFVAHVSQLHAVPDSVPDEQAILVDPLACALHGVLRHTPGDQERVLIQGGGIIGLGVAAGLRAVGCQAQVTALVRHAFQAGHMGAYGADQVILAPSGMSRAERYDRIGAAVGGRRVPAAFGNQAMIGGFDVVYDCVGTGASLTDAMNFTRGRGTTVEVGTTQICVVDTTPLWFKELTLVGVYGRQLETASGGPPRHTYELTLDLLASSKLKTDGLLTHTFALTDYRQALAALAGRSRTPAIKVAFRHSPD